MGVEGIGIYGVEGIKKGIRLLSASFYTVFTFEPC